MSFSIIDSAIHLDIKDLNFSYSSPSLKDLHKQDTTSPRQSIVIRIFVFFRNLVQSFFFLSLSFLKIPKHQPMSLVTTLNQEDAIKPIGDELSQLNIFGLFGYGNLHFPLLGAYIISIPFFPLVFKQYLKEPQNSKYSFKYSFELYWLIYGFYIVSRLFIKRLSPSVVIMSNDHFMYCRVLMQAALDEKVKVIYLQHASVSNRFPPLKMTFALLEGKDALLKYNEIGKSDTQVFLVGTPKFDIYYEKINRSPKIQTIGICINTLDPVHRVQELCDSILSKLLYIKLILRPHPADKNFLLWQSLSKKLNIEFSDSRVERSFTFLSRVDSIIVGESNIMLEAVTLNVFPFYYDFADTKLDNYGFLKNGLIENVYTIPSTLINAIKSIADIKPMIRNRAKFYNATIGTKYDGQSKKLVKLLIMQIANDNHIDLSQWKKIPLDNIVAYTM